MAKGEVKGFQILMDGSKKLTIEVPESEMQSAFNLRKKIVNVEPEKIETEQTETVSSLFDMMKNLMYQELELVEKARKYIENEKPIECESAIGTTLEFTEED